MLNSFQHPLGISTDVIQEIPKQVRNDVLIIDLYMDNARLNNENTVQECDATMLNNSINDGFITLLHLT